MGAKLTIEQMQALAKKRNGKCLSRVYVNSRRKLLWRCAQGHEWEAVPDSVNAGTWCPPCAGKLRGTIEQMQVVAKKHRGKCLSTTYVNNRTKLRWRCKKGHEWEATPSNVTRGTWCPVCAGKLAGQARPDARRA